MFLSTFLWANKISKKYIYIYHHYKSHLWEKIFWTDGVAFKALVQLLQVLHNSSLLLIFPQLFFFNQEVVMFQRSTANQQGSSVSVCKSTRDCLLFCHLTRVRCKTKSTLLMEQLWEAPSYIHKNHALLTVFAKTYIYYLPRQPLQYVTPLFFIKSTSYYKTLVCLNTFTN